MLIQFRYVSLVFLTQYLYWKWLNIAHKGNWCIRLMIINNNLWWIRESHWKINAWMMSIFNSMHADIFSWPICFIQIHVLIHNNLNTVISSFVSWEIVQNIIFLLALHWQNCSNWDLFIIGILYTNKTYFIILFSFTNQLFKIKSHKKHHSDPRNLTSSHEIHNYYFTPHS